MAGNLWSVTADLLSSPVRRRQSVNVCVAFQPCQHTQSISLPLSLHPIHFLSLLLLPRSYCPDPPVATPPLSILLFFLHPFGLSHTRCSSLFPSHILKFANSFYFLLPFFSPLSSHSPNPCHFLSPFPSSCTLISFSHLQPLPIICLFFPVFLFKRSSGFQSACLPSLWFGSIRLSFYERIWNKMCFWALHFFPLIWLHLSLSLSTTLKSTFKAGPGASVLSNPPVTYTRTNTCT